MTSPTPPCADPHRIWIEMHSGLKFFPLAPNPQDILIGDIAHHLSRICRYNGATTRHLSVAEHSCMVALQVWIITEDPAEALAALLHDSAEAYLGDILSPLKIIIPEIKTVEIRLLKIIFNKFDLNFPLSKIIETIDKRIWADERRQFLRPSQNIWASGAPLGVTYPGWTAAEAEREFLDCFERYKTLRDAKQTRGVIGL